MSHVYYYGYTATSYSDDSRQYYRIPTPGSSTRAFAVVYQTGFVTDIELEYL